MVKILFTANIQRHVACPETEADGANLREVPLRKMPERDLTCSTIRQGCAST
jgi:hypothetical protein